MTNESDNPKPYENLDPELLLAAIESVGFECDGRLLALNSYENRVYQVGIEGGSPVVVKFYRPGRWSDDQILEEHEFTLELAAREIPVVAPLVDANGNTLHHYDGFRFSVYPRRGGRTPELENLDHLAWMGRFIGRIHAVGGIKPFAHRPSLTIESFGRETSAFLLENGFIPLELERPYRDLVDELLVAMAGSYDQAGDIKNIRLHGDCHPGNILWTDQGPHFVDFDDARMGPAVQDLWMLLSGGRQDQTLQLDAVLDGYREFQDFDLRELHLIEALRTLRIIHYAAWLGRRWEDPAFQMNFPWFNTHHYWQEHVAHLREQLFQMEQVPLTVY